MQNLGAGGAEAVNIFNQVVGVFTVTGHAFLYPRIDNVQAMQDLGVLAGGQTSHANGLDNPAVGGPGNVTIVGQSDIGGGASRAFKWTSAGAMSSLRVLAAGNI